MNRQNESKVFSYQHGPSFCALCISLDPIFASETHCLLALLADKLDACFDCFLFLLFRTIIRNEHKLKRNNKTNGVVG